MFSLPKIEKLPRHQRLRKIAKIFHEAENRFHAADANVETDGIFKVEELGFFSQLAEFLQTDTSFSLAAITAFGEAAGVFKQPQNTPAQIYRALNTVRHILIAETGRSPADWDFTGAGGRLNPAQRRIFPGMLVYLEDIRSPFNVGAMFRTAESFGVEKVFVSPLCADPRHPRSLRSAMGCVDILPWEQWDPEKDAISGLPLFALETGGTPLGEFAFPQKGILIAGSEELGVNPRTLALADASLGRVSIPCYGAKGSLNVSVAFGIVMQSWAKMKVQ